MLIEEQVRKVAAEQATRAIKCVVWDLDNTIWDGVLLEDQQVQLRAGVRATLEELDRRGILHSIASRNDPELAMAKLAELGIQHYFLYPAIGWNAKSIGVRAIAEAINIGLEALAFVDDQQFEREEVGFAHPDVLLLDAADVRALLEMVALKPRFVTAESRIRRRLYQGDIVRKRAQEEHAGSDEAFLATLGMRFTIRRAEEDDLQRAEELTRRTHQLNATGYTYAYDELNAFRQSDDHLLLVASLEDKYGPYGTIGLALVELQPAAWTVKLLLMSCRVMSRGVGTVLMNYVMSQARDAGVRLRAEFFPTARNRMMYITYKFAGFVEVEHQGDLVVLETDLGQIQRLPAYVALDAPVAAAT
ncbi:MAG: HAD-IIIC family phosphatase [Chloroflexota bacterium]|nr:HAD-IIIC family phosphatase [Chloroflexota bacterium]